MRRAGWIAAIVLWTAVSGPLCASVYESAAAPAGDHPIDALVFARLKALNVRPVLCSDAVFVRRAFLDVLGTLPTAQEAREFIRDPDAKRKRAVLIDRLLERPEYADYWAMKWGDVLRIKSEFPVNLWPNAAQAYHRWVRASLAGNKPYDQFARELLTSSGSNFRVGPVNFYRAIQNRTPEGIAGAVALTFLSSRIEFWPTNRAAGLAAFFSQVGYKPTSEWKEEHVFWDPLGSSVLAGNSAPGRASLAAAGVSSNQAFSVVLTAAELRAPRTAMAPDGTVIALPPDRDPREVFADWLIAPSNPWFARSVANRVWAWLVGRGVIHEPDDIRDDNPPSDPALLACLERELVAGRFDLKRLCRFILSSQTYQLSSIPRDTRPDAAAHFASYPLRRLEAEVLIDAINKITGTSDLYTSPIPEPFTYIPEDQPAVALPDGSITSPFLALFGRSARATGLAAERDDKPVPAQWLHLLNSSHIQRKLEQGPNLKRLFESGLKPPQILDELYLTILSRPPTWREIRILEGYGHDAPAWQKARDNPGARKTPAAERPPVKRREHWVDIAWCLINSTEFLYRH